MPKRLKSGSGDARHAWVLFLFFVAWSAAAGTLNYIRDQHARPDSRQQIAAVLVSWGLATDGLPATVSDAEVQSHIAMLRSPISEDRVRAAWWLADHGVREAGADIAAAMADPDTLRPCQLAHNLGRLGDDRWIDELVRASQQQQNTDFRVCATEALGSLGSPRATAALIEVYHSGLPASIAIEALGNIADPSTLPFLQSVEASVEHEEERRLARRAIERAEVMAEPDPVAPLIERLRASAARGSPDAWAIRQLALRGDRRAVDALALAMSEKDHVIRQNHHILLAAALLAHGPEGTAALRRIANSRSGTAAATAQAALSLATGSPMQLSAMLAE